MKKVIKQAHNNTMAKIQHSMTTILKNLRMRKISCFGLLLIFLFNLVSCGIDQKNFDFPNHIVDNDELIKELENWDVDSAYIQFIGFAPNEDFKYYKDLSMDAKMSGVYPEEFFEQFDIKQPIIKVWALRKNTYSGNTFDEAGIGSKDLVDYSKGVGKREARFNHSLGDYSGETYEWSSFYLASQNGKLRMLSSGYPEDRSCIDFYNDVIKLNDSQTKEVLKTSKQVGMYIKGKGIVMVEPDKLNKIIAKKSDISKITNPDLSSDTTYIDKNNESEIVEEPEGNNYEINEGFSGQASVIVEKAYFHDNSDESTKRKAYIVKGEQVSYTNRENGFIYIEYTNTNNKTTKGWMKESDFGFN
jgi:hypothetical protein